MLLTLIKDENLVTQKPGKMLDFDRNALLIVIPKLLYFILGMEMVEEAANVNEKTTCSGHSKKVWEKRYRIMCAMGVLGVICGNHAAPERSENQNPNVAGENPNKSVGGEPNKSAAGESDPNKSLKSLKSAGVLNTAFSKKSLFIPEIAHQVLLETVFDFNLLPLFVQFVTGVPQEVKNKLRFLHTYFEPNSHQLNTRVYTVCDLLRRCHPDPSIQKALLTSLLDDKRSSSVAVSGDNGATADGEKERKRSLVLEAAALSSGTGGQSGTSIDVHTSIKGPSSPKKKAGFADEVSVMEIGTRSDSVNQSLSYESLYETARQSLHSRHSVARNLESEIGLPTRNLESEIGAPVSLFVVGEQDQEEMQRMSRKSTAPALIPEVITGTEEVVGLDGVNPQVMSMEATADTASVTRASTSAAETSAAGQNQVAETSTGENQVTETSTGQNQVITATTDSAATVVRTSTAANDTQQSATTEGPSPSSAPENDVNAGANVEGQHTAAQEADSDAAINRRLSLKASSFLVSTLWDSYPSLMLRMVSTQICYSYCTDFSELATYHTKEESQKVDSFLSVIEDPTANAVGIDPQEVQNPLLADGVSIPSAHSLLEHHVAGKLTNLSPRIKEFLALGGANGLQSILSLIFRAFEEFDKNLNPDGTVSANKKTFTSSEANSRKSTLQLLDGKISKEMLLHFLMEIVLQCKVFIGELPTITATDENATVHAVNSAAEAVTKVFRETGIERTLVFGKGIYGIPVNLKAIIQDILGLMAQTRTAGEDTAVYQTVVTESFLGPSGRSVVSKQSSVQSNSPLVIDATNGAPMFDYTATQSKTVADGEVKE